MRSCWNLGGPGPITSAARAGSGLAKKLDEILGRIATKLWRSRSTKGAVVLGEIQVIGLFAYCIWVS